VGGQEAALPLTGPRRLAIFQARKAKLLAKRSSAFGSIRMYERPELRDRV
jgi:hypothetical protein